MTVKTAEIDGNKIRYFEKGVSKETLLLLHGLGASAERWSNDSSLDAKKIRSFGIVAYGRDYISDVSVSTIEFYY